MLLLIRPHMHATPFTNTQMLIPMRPHMHATPSTLQAQCTLFRRYPHVLHPFKYAGFPLLLQAVTLPPGPADEAAPDARRAAAPPASAAAQQAQQAQQAQHFLSPEVAPRLQAAVELCWLTCACSRLNGEELTRSGGVALLGELLMRCVAGGWGGVRCGWVGWEGSESAWAHGHDGRV
jgi:hypothetical protein